MGVLERVVDVDSRLSLKNVLLVISIIFLFSFFFLLPFLSFTVYGSTSPQLNPSHATIREGETINGTFICNGSESGAVSIDGEANFTFSKGRFNLTADNLSDSVRILFYSVSSDGHVVTRLGSYTFLHPPKLFVEPKESSLSVQEGRAIYFSAETNTTIEWFFDARPVKGATKTLEFLKNDSSYLRFWPSFNDSGTHNLTLRGTQNKLQTTKTWNITVLNVNQPPVQIATIPPLTLPINGSDTLDLRNYFIDPDSTPLKFSLKQQPLPKTLSQATIEVHIDRSVVQFLGLKPGRQFIQYSAEDLAGARVTSEPVRYDVLDKKLSLSDAFCGDRVCLSPENCSSCTVDCGPCDTQRCTPVWSCSEWSSCLPPGYSYRNCTELTNCEAEGLKPPEAKICTGATSCFDGIKSGDESGVDCGGSCSPCPSCTDGLLNQGELGVDCGGPCSPCPSCSDNVLNNGESDVDCGGPCSPCEVGESCFAPLDCTTKVCKDEVCVVATCKDGILNQDESGVDCGGSCSPCPSCTDGLLNQGELGVDCGGPCSPCPSCSDGLRNQGEWLIDCGGPCKGCALKENGVFILQNLSGRFFPITLLLLLGVLLLLYRGYNRSKVALFFSNGKNLQYFYENRILYRLIRFWGRLTRVFRHHPEAFYSILEMGVKDISTLLSINDLPDSLLLQGLDGKLRALYATLFTLSLDFTLESLVSAVKRSGFSMSIKVIILRNTKFLALLEKNQYYKEVGFEYTIKEVLSALEELRRVL